MNPFVFQSPTRVCFGEHMSATAYDLVQEFGGQNPLLVTDDFLVKSGIVDPIIDQLPEKNGRRAVVSDVPADSDVACVDRTAAIAREMGCDSLIAVGGGSVMDTAKVVNICLALGGNILDHQGLNLIQEPIYPMIAVPTTAGTGSEVSFVAMVKDNQEGRKLVFGSRFLAPSAAILDPTLIVSLPPRLTAATGLDAITHNIECLACSVTRSHFTDALAIDSLKRLFEYLPRATADGADLEARSQTLIASTMAGVAFSNAGVGIIHALAHATGATFKTHHGMTNAVFLPHGIRFNLDTSADRYAYVARELNLMTGSANGNNEECTESLAVAIEDLLTTVDLPRSLKDLGVPNISPSQLTDWANLVIEDPALMFNPKEASAEDAIDIFKRAY